MKKRLAVVLAVLMILASSFLFSGCAMRRMLDGQWQLAQQGDKAGMNLEDVPIPYTFDIYSDGKIEMMGSYLGNFSISRDTFKMTDENGELYASGSFELQNGNHLVIILDDQAVSYTLDKLGDHK